MQMRGEKLLAQNSGSGRMGKRNNVIKTGKLSPQECFFLGGGLGRKEEKGYVFIR